MSVLRLILQGNGVEVNKITAASNPIAFKPTLALNFVRLAQLSAERLTAKLTGQPGSDPLLQINTDEVIGTTPAWSISVSNELTHQRQVVI